jgi:hypothetical protein
MIVSDSVPSTQEAYKQPNYGNPHHMIVSDSVPSTQEAYKPPNYGTIGSILLYGSTLLDGFSGVKE